MKRTVLTLSAAVVAVGAATVLHTGGSAAAADPVTTSPSATIVVDGLGTATGRPDVLTATLGVSVLRPTVARAYADAGTLQGRVLAALKKDGVAAADLQTSGVSVDPEDDDQGRRRGYRVQQTLSVTLRELPRAGRVLGDAVAAGGNSAVLQDVALSLQDDTALRARAREAAFADAKGKAQRYAELSGRTLGSVLLVSESSSPVGLSSDSLAGSGGSAAPTTPVPVEAGSQDVSVTVTVRFALV